MTDLREQIVAATVDLADCHDWVEILIDIEVEQRGLERDPYVADSSVAVCFCRIDNEWCGLDLDISPGYRGLFHTLMRAEGVSHGTYRLSVSSGGGFSWQFDPGLPARLHGQSTAAVDQVVEAKLSALVNEPG